MTLPQPLWNRRALKAGNTLALADLHIGYERDLYKKGVRIPSNTPDMVKRVSKILELQEVEILMIIGDLKHNIPQSSWQEYEEIPKAIEKWLKLVDEIHLVPGNHDGGIEKYLPSDVIIHPSKGTVIGGVGYIHGHALPSDEVLQSDMIVMGHDHPAITLTDSLGTTRKEHCWVRVKFESEMGTGEAVIVPNFNTLLGGTSINTDGHLSPFFRHVFVKKEKIYLLDGTFLGNISDIP